MNCWRSPLCWSQIFGKTYKLLCSMWCVMCDVWCVMFQTWFFVRSWLYESRGDQKHPIWVISDLFNDIPKLIPGGSCMYTISCKASYTRYHSSSQSVNNNNNKKKTLGIQNPCYHCRRCHRHYNQHQHHQTGEW